MVETIAGVVSEEPSKETAATDEEAAKVALPPAIPLEPNAVYLPKNSGPRHPLSIPAPPPPVPGVPKSAPKPPSIPKTK